MYSVTFYGNMFTPYPTRYDDAVILRAASRVRRALPANLDPADRPLFEYDLERDLPPMRLLDLRGIRVSGQGMLFKDGRILPESFASPATRRQFLSRKRSVLRCFITHCGLRRRRKIADECLWITDDWSYGYFHWLTDPLARLYAVRDQAPHTTLLLPHRLERLEFVQSSLKLFGDRRVEYVHDGEICCCDRLLLPVQNVLSGNHNEEVLRGLRDLITTVCGRGSPTAAAERIYISRSRAPRRKVANEGEILDTLREFGFHIMYFEDLPFVEQVAAARGARFLISNHGAGLTNMLFMPPGGAVMELRRAGEREHNWFFNLASAMGLTYFYQNCPQEDPAEEAHSANIVVDPNPLRRNLKTMLDGQRAPWRAEVRGAVPYPSAAARAS